MIALLLAVQLSAQALPAAPPAQLFAPPSPIHPSEIIRALPKKAPCGGPNAGRLEASFAQPAALYRKGDRPAHGLKNWIDYPDGQLCLVSARTAVGDDPGLASGVADPAAKREDAPSNRR